MKEVAEEGFRVSSNGASATKSYILIGVLPTFNRSPTSLNSNILFFPKAISRFPRSKASVSRISSLERAYWSNLFGIVEAWSTEVR